MHGERPKIERSSLRASSRSLPVVCFFLEMAASLVVGLQPQINVIWIANGLLLAYLLLAPRWRWRWLFAAGSAGQFLGSVLAHTHDWQINLAIVILNMAEVAVAAFLLRRRSTKLPVFTDRFYLMRFVAFGVIAAPALVGGLFAVIAHGWTGMGLWPGFRDWFSTDALGIAVATPAFVAIFRTQFKETLRSRSALVYPILLAVAAPVLFHQGNIPAWALIYPLLILIQLRLGLGWASAAMLYVSGTGSFMVQGPATSATANSLLGPVGSGLRLQMMITSVMFILYAISVVVDNLRITQHKLRDTVYLHHLVTENSRDVIIISDFHGNRNYVSSAHATMGGWTREELLNLHSMDLIHPDDHPRAAEMVRQLQNGRDAAATLECRVRRRDGTYLWVEASLRAIRDPGKEVPTGILNIVRDISERKRAEQSREFHQSLLGAIHEGSLDGILVVDDEGKAVSYNRRFAEVWQITAPDVPCSLLKPIIDVSDERLLSQCIGKTKDPAAFVARVQELYADPHADDQCEVELEDGRTLERYTTTLHSEDGRYLGRVWFFRDITERIQAEHKLQAAYEEVEKLAVVDPLLGIANRRRFDEYLAAEWRRAGRARQPLSMIVVDVDLFKLYNDTYGHVQGDACLKQIADSIVDVVTRAGDLVARFGGEEFAIVLPNTDERGALAVAAQLWDAVRKRAIDHGGSPYGVVTLSAGCATMVPEPGVSPSRLIESADLAMYEAKRAGRNRVCANSEREFEAPDQALEAGRDAIPPSVSL